MSSPQSASAAATAGTPPTAGGVIYISYNGSYVHTIAGQLKIACFVLNLIGIICIQISVFSALKTGSFFSSVAFFGLWFTGIMFLLYLFQVVYKLSRCPWLQIEMWVCVAMTLLYLLAASLAATQHTGAYVTASFFGFCAMLAYGYDAFLKWRTLREATVTVVRTTTVTAHQTQVA